MKNKKEFKISEGFTKMTDFLAQKIYVRFPNLHMDLQSLNSLYGYSLVKLAKKGIQRTASMYDTEDIWEYLVTVYGLKELEVLKSNSLKTYLLDSSIILNYASEVTTNPELKADLRLLYTSVKLKENINELEELLTCSSDNELPRTISPTAFVQNGHIKYRPKCDLTSSLIVTLTQDTKINVSFYTALYYKYLTTQCWGTLPQENVNDWTFLEGKKREDESQYLEAILDGHIVATSKIGKAIQSEYFRQMNIRGKDFMFIDTLEERRQVLDRLYVGLDKKGYEVKGLTDFCVYYRKKSAEELNATNKEYLKVSKDGDDTKLKKTRRKRVKHEVIIATGYYVFDADNREFLPSINRVLGYHGEFTREKQRENQLAYTLINSDSEYEDFYKVEDDPNLFLSDIPMYDYNGANSEVISSLVKTGQQSTEIDKIRRREANKRQKQVESYWSDALRYEEGRKVHVDKHPDKV